MLVQARVKENPTVAYVNRVFRAPAGIAERNGYGGTQALYDLRQSLNSNNLTEPDASKRYFKYTKTSKYERTMYIRYGAPNNRSFQYYTEASRKSASVTVIRNRINVDKIRSQWGRLYILVFLYS